MIELGENIKNYLTENFGEEYLNKYAEYIDTEPTQYVRMNRMEPDIKGTIENLKKYGITLEKVDGVPYAYKVTQGEREIGKTLEFVIGKYYIQSLSSMMPPLVLQPEQNSTIMDLCAAPGSKTTQLCEMMDNTGALFANEIAGSRTRSLVHNLEKIASVNFGVINKKGEELSKFFDNYFDKVLVDAPCSAMGIIQKKGEVSNWWNERQMEKIAENQWKLLISAIKMAKPGAEIVYSTCTLALEENEFILDKILEKYPVELVDFELPVPSSPAFTKIRGRKLNPSIGKAKRILPWEINSEGFFVAKLIKTEETSEREKVHVKGKHSFLKKNDAKLKGYLDHLGEAFGIDRNIFENYRYYIKKNHVYFITDDWDTSAPDIFQRIGLKFAIIDKNDTPYLHPVAARVLGKYANKNITEFTELKDLEIYFNGGTVKREFENRGKQVIKYGNYILGTGVISVEGLKSQFPRSMRTQEIIIR